MIYTADFEVDGHVFFMSFIVNYSVKKKPVENKTQVWNLKG